MSCAKVTKNGLNRRMMAVNKVVEMLISLSLWNWASLEIESKAFQKSTK
jgi:hypothetical protein